MINNQSNLDKTRNYLLFIMATKGKEPTHMSIESIPKVWSKFGDTENTWINIPLPPSQNATSCLFKGKKGYTMFPHYHNVKERFYILNKKGKIKVNTKSTSKIINYPNGFEFEPGDVHLLEYLEYTELLFIWTPKFEQGWEASTFD